MSEREQLQPIVPRAFAEQRSWLAPGRGETFRAFSGSVFAEGALLVSAKQATDVHQADAEAIAGRCR